MRAFRRRLWRVDTCVESIVANLTTTLETRISSSRLLSGALVFRAIGVNRVGCSYSSRSCRNVQSIGLLAYNLQYRRLVLISSPVLTWWLQSHALALCRLEDKSWLSSCPIWNYVVLRGFDARLRRSPRASAPVMGAQTITLTL